MRVMFGVIAIAIGVSVGKGQAQPPAKSKAAPPATVAKQSRTPGPVVEFDADSVVRPDRISSLAAIYARLSPGPKSEFETTAQYTERVQSHMSGQSLPSRLAVLATGVGCMPRLTYDADNGEWKGYLKTDAVGVTNNYADVTSSILTECTTTDEGSYPASNAYGAKVVVNKYNRTSYEINSSNRHSLGLLPELHVPMEPAVAQRVKDNLVMLVVFTLKSDAWGRAIFDTTSYHEPTRETPVEMFGARRIVNATDIWLWFYDQRTGAVLTKIDTKEFRDPLMR